MFESWRTFSHSGSQDPVIAQRASARIMFPQNLASVSPYEGTAPYGPFVVQFSSASLMQMDLAVPAQAWPSCWPQTYSGLSRLGGRQEQLQAAPPSMKRPASPIAPVRPLATRRLRVARGSRQRIEKLLGDWVPHWGANKASGRRYCRGHSSYKLYRSCECRCWIVPGHSRHTGYSSRSPG